MSTSNAPDVPRGRSKPTIAFDCDGVILSWRKGFGQHVHDKLGLELTDEDFQHGDCFDYPTFHAARLAQSDIDGLLESYFTDGPAILEDDLIPQCWEWLKQWANPVIVTNRSKGCNTKAKLTELGIEAEVINNTGTKSGWALLVDDWSEHCLSNQATGGQSILYEQPWSGSGYVGPAVSAWRDLAIMLEDVMAEEKARVLPKGASPYRRCPPGGTQDYERFMRRRYGMMGAQLSLLDTEGGA